MNAQKLQDIISQSMILEMDIVGSLSSTAKAIENCIVHCDSKYFLNSKTKRLFDIIVECYIKKISPVETIQKEKLVDLYAETLDRTLFNVQIENTIRLQKKLWLQFESIKLLRSHAETTFEDPLADIAQILNDLNEISNGHNKEEVDISFISSEYQKERDLFAEKMREGKELIGYSTGYEKLEPLADGLRNGHLWIVSGYTSMGKTFLALNLVVNLMKQGVPVSFYSLEMSKVDLYGRLLGIITGIPSIKILKGQLTESEKQSVENARELIANSGLRVHSEKNKLDEIMMSMNMEVITKVARVFVIDYAQNIKAKGLSQYETLAKLSVDLQSFCVTKGVPVMLLSQVSNEAAKNPQSDVIGLKGAGELSASADIVIELVPNQTREEREQNIVAGLPIYVKACVKKNRHGKVRNINMLFHGTNGRFEEEQVFTNLKSDAEIKELISKRK